MKTFLYFFFSLILLLAGSVLKAQTPDPLPIEQTSVYNYMLWSALLGVIARFFASAIKAIKFNPNTPNKFDPKYWITDNAWAKVQVAITFILSFGFIDQLKLTQNTWGIVILCIVSATCGWALDWVAEFIDKLKKFKPAPAQPLH